MLSVEQRSAKSWVKCACCGEQVRTDEKYLQVVKDDKNVRGERYCMECESEAYSNNDIGMEDLHALWDKEDGESHLRQMEDYAAYSAAGCTGEYWGDRDAGYAH